MYRLGMYLESLKIKSSIPYSLSSHSPFSLMVTLTKDHGLKEILNYLLIILLVLQNAGEIILITRLLMLLRIYGKIIISWEAQIGFLSLVPNHILMPLLICKLLIIVIQGVFSSRGKLQRLFSFTLNYFDIYWLAGSTALLLFLHSSYLFSRYLLSSYVLYFHLHYILCFHLLLFSSASPSPFMV